MSSLRLMLFAIVGMSVLALAAAAREDELELTSGTKYRGKLLRKTPDGVTFQIITATSVSEMTFPPAMVKNVIVDPKTVPPLPAPKTAASAPAAPAATAKSEQPADPGRPTARSKEQVEALVAEAGKTMPAWFDAVQTDHPAGLELTWTAPPPRTWDPDKYLIQYLQNVAKLDTEKWKPTIKLLHEVLSANKGDEEKLKKTADWLGVFYELLDDYAHAAFWYRRGGHDFVGLARCYWRLGSKELTREICSRVASDPNGVIVGLWAAMGELPKAVALAEAAAKSFPPDIVYVHAADGCRSAGAYKQALDFYQKALNAKADRPKFTALAEEGIQTVKLIQTLDASKLKDGSHTGTGKGGYRGPIVVQVSVKEGKIEAVKVVESKEDEAYFDNANNVIPRRFTQQQGFVGVDSVSGATISSDTIIAAIAQALASAAK